MKKHKTVESYIEAEERWQDELVHLRKILLSTELEETVKWGSPCYTYDGKNTVGLGAFKSYVALWFYQGALLADEERVLINAQEGKTRALRQWRFESKREIKTRLVKAYVAEAIGLVKGGREIKPQRKGALAIPPELSSALAKSKPTRAAFEKLTPGKQREYAEYVTEAKRDATKATRLEKILPMIRAGQGLNDRYRG